MSLIAGLMEPYGVMNLSKETGIDRVTLWRFMRGGRLPRLDTLQKILTVLGIRVQFSFEERMQNFLEYTYWRKQTMGSRKSQQQYQQSSTQRYSSASVSNRGEDSPMKGLIDANRLPAYLKSFKPNGYYDYILNIVLRDIGGTGQSRSGFWGH